MLEKDNNFQTLYFRDGHLYKISCNKNDWYDPAIIVSDGISYSMSDPLSISSMPAPNFKILDNDNIYGTTGALDYVLRMKAGRCFKRKEKELCSTLLWKSTELMFANKHYCWRQYDYERLIYWHHKLGMYSEANRAIRYLESKGFIIILLPEQKPKKSIKSKSNKSNLTYSEQEHAIVNMTTDAHMQQLTDFPFVWNLKIQKHITSNSHPFCFMNISSENVLAVKKELMSLNIILQGDCSKYKIPDLLYIPVNDLVFDQQCQHGYTRFICSPITIDGGLSEYPISLNFTTPSFTYSQNSSIPIALKNTTHGIVTYGLDGSMKKADVFFWRNGKGYFFYYRTVNDCFMLTKLEKSPSRP